MLSLRSTCRSSAEDAFGPSVEGCFDDFDFTLLFEESILTIVPLAIFLVILPFRLVYLCKRKKVARGGLLHISKLVSLLPDLTFPCYWTYQCFAMDRIGRFEFIWVSPAYPPNSLGQDIESIDQGITRYSSLDPRLFYSLPISLACRALPLGSALNSSYRLLPALFAFRSCSYKNFVAATR